MTWFEVTGNDAARLRAFYADVFRWRTADVARGASYGVMDAIAHGIGGGIGTTPQSDRHVTLFVEVDDLAAAPCRIALSPRALAAHAQPRASIKTPIAGRLR